MVVWIQADYSKRGWLLRYVLVLIDVRNAAADNGRVPCSLRPERVRHVGVSPYRRGIVRVRGSKRIVAPGAHAEHLMIWIHD